MTYDPKAIISSEIFNLNEQEKQQGAEILRPRFHTKKLADIVDTVYPVLKEPVKGLIVEGATVFAGASKSGKSWMALQLCMCVAAGVPFLERQTDQGSVLYLALEDSERRLKDRATKLSLLTGIRKEQYGQFIEIRTQAPTVKDGLIDLLETWITDHPDAKLICIDVMQKVRGITPGRVNMYQDDYAYLTTFADLAKKHRVAILLLHHVNRKDSKTLGDPFDVISGSNGIKGTVDTAIILTRKRDQSQATMIFEGRDVIRNEIVLMFQY